MGDTRIALSISALLSDPARLESYARLRASLESEVFDAILIESEPGENWEWSGRMWEASNAIDAEWHVFLQDDTIVCPNFRDRFERISAISGEYDVIGLHVVHPAAPTLADEGYRGFTSADSLIGVGYAMTGAALREFLDWRAALPVAGMRAMTEDTLIGLFCVATGRRIYHPIPAPIDHDTSLPSTYGNDRHPFRASSCFGAKWPDSGIRNLRVPHLGCFYGQETAAKLHALGLHAAGFIAEQDTGGRELRRLSYARRSRDIAGEAEASLFVATPHLGQVHPEYAASVWRLLNLSAIDISGSTLEIQDVQLWNADVCRTRNRFAHHFLKRTDATHILFVDSDVFFEPSTVLRMLHAAKGFVAAPYPRRDHINLARVAALPGEVHEAAAYSYSVRPLPDFDPKGAGFAPDSAGCAKVEGMPLGFALINRETMQQVSNAATTYADEITGETADIFGLIRTPEGHLLSEDYSFCRRLREIGIDVHMYLGPGSPVGHAGQHLYRGAIESFGLKRLEGVKP